MIVSSEVVGDSSQIDGRRHIIERHIDDTGRETLIFYMAELLEDESKALFDRVPQLDELEEERVLREQEVSQLTKVRALELLTLPDSSIAKILRLDPLDALGIVEVKQRLTRESIEGGDGGH